MIFLVWVVRCGNWIYIDNLTSMFVGLMIDDGSRLVTARCMAFELNFGDVQWLVEEFCRRLLDIFRFQFFVFRPIIQPGLIHSYALIYFES